LLVQLCHRAELDRLRPGDLGGGTTKDEQQSFVSHALQQNRINAQFALAHFGCKAGHHVEFFGGDDIDCKSFDDGSS
jgi:hypothetical protein